MTDYAVVVLGSLGLAFVASLAILLAYWWESRHR
jgi:hypothetical protein